MAKEKEPKAAAVEAAVEPKTEPKVVETTLGSVQETALLATDCWRKTTIPGTDTTTYELLAPFVVGPESFPLGMHRPLDYALLIEARRPK